MGLWSMKDDLRKQGRGGKPFWVLEFIGELSRIWV